MNNYYTIKTIKSHSNYLKDTHPQANISQTTVLLPNFHRNISPRYSQNNSKTISMKTNVIKIRGDYKPQVKTNYIIADSLEKLDKYDQGQTNMSYYGKDEIYKQNLKKINRTQLVFNNRNSSKKKENDENNKIDSLIFPKNKGRIGIIGGENTKCYTFSGMDGQYSVDQKEAVIMMQSLWRGIILRKQVVEQLTIYYRNRDFAKITIRLIMLNLYDVFQILKTCNSKKQHIVVRKDNCFKSNVLIGSNIQKIKKENSTHAIGNNFLKESNMRIRNDNTNDNIIENRFDDPPKILKKKNVLKNKAHKEIGHKDNEAISYNLRGKAISDVVAVYNPEIPFEKLNNNAQQLHLNQQQQDEKEQHLVKIEQQQDEKEQHLVKIEQHQDEIERQKVEKDQHQDDIEQHLVKIEQHQDEEEKHQDDIEQQQVDREKHQDDIEQHQDEKEKHQDDIEQQQVDREKQQVGKEQEEIEVQPKKQYEEESPIKQQRQYLLANKKIKTNSVINTIDIIKNEDEFTIQAQYSKENKNIKQLLSNVSFSFEIKPSKIIKSNRELSSRIFNNKEQNHKISKVNIFEFIQSKINHFDLTHLYKETNNPINYIYTSSLPQSVAEKHNTNSDIPCINAYSINQFYESFIITKQDETINEKEKIENIQEEVFSYSFVPPIKIKKLPIEENIEALLNNNDKVILSNRTMLSKRFNRFVTDDLIDYSSHRRKKINEDLFNIEQELNLNSFDITTNNFELISNKASFDDTIFHTHNKFKNFSIMDSIFVNNISSNLKTTRAIGSFSVSYIKQSPEFKIDQNYEKSIEVINSFSLINDDEAMSPTFGSREAVRKKNRTVYIKGNNQKVSLPKTLKTIIFNMICRYVSSVLYDTLLKKNDLMVKMITNKKYNLLKRYVMKWKYAIIKIKVIEDINQNKLIGCRKYSIENNYSICLLSDKSNNLPKNNDQSLQTIKENKDLTTYSDRIIIPSSFSNLTNTFDSSFQLLNIKTSITHHHFSNRNMKHLRSAQSRNNTPELSMISITNTSNTFTQSPRKTTFAYSNQNNNDIIANDPKYLQKIHLWRIVSNLSSKQYNIAYKRYFKWRMSSSSSHYLLIKAQSILRDKVLNITVEINQKCNRKHLLNYFCVWRNIKKKLCNCNQVITFRIDGIAKLALVLKEVISTSQKIIKKKVLDKLFSLTNVSNGNSNILEGSMQSSPNISFLSSNRCSSPQNIINRIFSFNEEVEADLRPALRIKHVRNRTKKETHLVLHSNSANIEKMKKSKQMKIKIISQSNILPPRLSIPFKKQNVLSKEKLQLKNVIQELKIKIRKGKAKRRETALFRIINTNYTKYLRSQSSISLIEVYYRKWLFIHHFSLGRDRNILMLCLMNKLNKKNELKRYFLRWKTINSHKRKREASNVISSQKRYSMFLSLYIYFNQWKYINNAEIVQMKHILNGFSRLVLFFIKYYKIMLMIRLKTI